MAAPSFADAFAGVVSDATGAGVHVFVQAAPALLALPAIWVAYRVVIRLLGDMS